MNENINTILELDKLVGDLMENAKQKAQEARRNTEKRTVLILEESKREATARKETLYAQAREEIAQKKEEMAAINQQKTADFQQKTNTAIEALIDGVLKKILYI